MRSWSPYALLVVAAIALDQWIKHLVETGLAFQEKLDLVPFLALFRTYNTGIAFSMFSSFGDTGLIVIVAGGRRLRAVPGDADRAVARSSPAPALR